MKNSWSEKFKKNLDPGQSFLVWGTVVLLLAAFMRLIILQDLPPGLAQDEVLNADIVNFIRAGYNALFFREGYGHEPLYHYWSVPFQVLFGDNVLSIRLPAVYLGVLLVALTMRWARREFGSLVAAVTGMGLAISWWSIIFSRLGLRPILEPFLLILFAWFWPRRPWIAGALLGLSVYSYTGARVVFLWPVLLFFYGLLLSENRQKSFTKFFKWTIPVEAVSAAKVLLIALLIVLPLFVTLQLDPTLQQRVDQLAGPLNALNHGDLQPILSSTLATLGVFSFRGDPRWTYSIPGKPLFGLLTSLFFYGGLILAIVRFRRPAYAFGLIWLCVGLIPSAITPQAPSTVRLIGAMPAVYLMPALFIAWLWDRTKKGQDFMQKNSRGVSNGSLGILTILLMFILFVVNISSTVIDGFINWPQALETRLKYQSVYSDIARHIEENPDAEYVIADGFYRPITAATLNRDLGWQIKARWVQTGEDLAGAIVLPGEGKGNRYLYIPEYAPPDPQLFAAAGIHRKPLFRSERQPSFAVYDLENIALNRGQDVATFGGILTLVGYDFFPSEDQNSLQLITHWRVEEPMPEDLSTFIHWFDDQGNLISQHDGLDAAPGTLRAGDQILQRHILKVPSPIQPIGNLELGLYTRGDGKRLLHDEGQVETSDRLTISLNNLNNNRSREN